MSGTLLPLKTYVNAQGPLYAPASGGGGGGGGPVLNVSTINFNSVGSAGNVPAQQNMRNGGDGAGGLGAFNGAVIAFDMDPGPVSTMLFGYNSANNALQITQNTVGTLTNGALQVGALQGISSIQSGVLFLENINAAGQYPYRMRANSGTAFIENSATGEPGDLTVSTMTVSSINGQVPAYVSYLSSLFAANPSLSTILY
jgi:hypothetical protein